MGNPGRRRGVGVSVEFGYGDFSVEGLRYKRKLGRLEKKRRLRAIAVQRRPQEGEEKKETFFREPSSQGAESPAASNHQTVAAGAQARRRKGKTGAESPLC